MQKSRYIVLTDINNGIEVDDRQSLIRLLLYSNEIDLEGIFAVTSCFLKHGAKKYHEKIIHKIIDAYGKDKPNLEAHKSGYPPAGYLHSITACGIDVYGKAPGNGYAESRLSENPAVRRLIEAVDRDDERPLWVGIWGGANTLAQAVWTAQQEKSAEEFDRFLKKLRIYSISDQDTAGKWLRDNYGDRLFYIVSPSPPDRNGSREYYKATWPGISADRNGHGSIDGKTRSNGFRGADFFLVSNKWIRRNINTCGHLGKLYPKTKFITEGDSPSFIGLIPNGLNVPERPDYGGWGGRYVLKRPDSEKHPFYTNSLDTVTGNDGIRYTSPQASVWRWREELQNDFAGRMKWTVTPDYNGANHNPETGASPTTVTAFPGQQVILTDNAADNQDGSFRSWLHYAEAGGNTFYYDFQNEKTKTLVFSVPEQCEPDNEIHIILKKVKSGSPPMASYRRFIIKIKESETNQEVTV